MHWCRDYSQNRVHIATRHTEGTQDTQRILMMLQSGLVSGLLAYVPWWAEWASVGDSGRFVGRLDSGRL